MPQQQFTSSQLSILSDANEHLNTIVTSFRGLLHPTTSAIGAVIPSNDSAGTLHLPEVHQDIAQSEVSVLQSTIQKQHLQTKVYTQRMVNSVQLLLTLVEQLRTSSILYSTDERMRTLQQQLTDVEQKRQASDERADELQHQIDELVSKQYTNLKDSDAALLAQQHCIRTQLTDR